MPMHCPLQLLKNDLNRYKYKTTVPVRKRSCFEQVIDSKLSSSSVNNFQYFLEKFCLNAVQFDLSRLAFGKDQFEHVFEALGGFARSECMHFKLLSLTQDACVTEAGSKSLRKCLVISSTYFVSF